MIELFRNKRVLVTGGAGFLGSFLCEELVRQGAHVTILDKLQQGTSRIDHLLKSNSIKLVTGDLLDKAGLLKQVSNAEFVWHLAGNTDIPAGLRDTTVDLNNGIIATHNLLEAMRATQVRKIAFSSSGAIYGEHTSGKRSETNGPTLPISLYGAGKIACEALLSAYAHLFKLQAWIFRYGNIISGRISHGAILDFIRKLQVNPNELEVLGDGTQTKSYLLAEECIEGMFYIIHQTVLKDDEGYCDVFNIGADEETAVIDIAKMVIEEMGFSNCKIKIKGDKRGWPGDQAKIALDISKVKRLGWRPKSTSAQAVRTSVKRMLANQLELKS